MGTRSSSGWASQSRACATGAAAIILKMVSRTSLGAE